VYDEIAQAMSGLMDITGPRGGMPTLVGTSIVDHITGIYSALGAMAALEERWRTGRGQVVDIALVYSAMSTLLSHMPWFLLTGETSPRNGNSHPLHAAINTYPTKDGYVHVVCPMDQMWAKLAKVIGREDLATHPDYATMKGRFAHKAEVDELISAWMVQRTSAEAAETLSAAGVACGPVRTIPEVAVDPAVRQTGMLLNVVTPRGETVQVMGNPVKLGGAPAEVRHSPPSLGEHNTYVYGELLGFSKAEIATLRREEVI
jgi:crotonobetainyl-CoA:carnitine CoA-transferase CaiB-like acyl-CoA transferase